MNCRFGRPLAGALASEGPFRQRERRVLWTLLTAAQHLNDFGTVDCGTIRTEGLPGDRYRPVLCLFSAVPGVVASAPSIQATQATLASFPSETDVGQASRDGYCEFKRKTRGAALCL